MEKLNPYYGPEKLGLRALTLNEPDLSYEYNMLLFVKPNGSNEVYWAHDSGCSCPTPFEDYEGETQEEVLQKMERVRDENHLMEIVATWEAAWRKWKYVVPDYDDTRRQIAEWFHD